MKFTLVFLATLAASVMAQEKCKALADAIPACGKTCIDAGAASAGCKPGDYACMCAARSKFEEQSVKCVAAAPGCAADVVKIKSGADAVCKCATGK